jgi:PHD/YefM family antitoxin component YafN of YafNO toxin-antitoxin module
MKVGAAGIETISGALKRPKKQNGHSHGNYLVATHRVAATTNPNCQRVYSFEADRYERSTQPTSKELAVRARFTAVAAAIKTRKADLMRVTEDEAAFMAQKNLPGGKQTLKAWYWMVCGNEYDQEHGN